MPDSFTTVSRITAEVITRNSNIDFSVKLLLESSKIFNTVTINERIADKVPILLSLSDKPK